MKKLYLLLMLLPLMTACVTSPTGRSQLMLISPEAAIVESRAAYLTTVADFDENARLVNDPTLSRRVATITGRLVSVAVAEYPQSAGWDWSVAIVDAPDTVNAWCMAGGRMAIYTGLFKKLKLTDDEFAQIMGHEISHALAHHTAERMSRAMATTAGIAAVSVATEKSTWMISGAALAAKLALELPNSRTAEREADRIGLELATRAGYDPDAAVSLWDKMAAAGGNGPPEFLSTHPSPGNRQAALAAMAAEIRNLNPTGRKAPVHPVTIMQPSSP
ncbi:peptidase M48 Ste24p [Kineobactrum sediminis]|uniref:Peptidase M48 Ste24p n=1 Tax=Kineobactrum sediminis TaxID=1905677 RepID=A0A2N5Y5K9_9GAMM|nr:M48 family metallopeptidase [Kineobactrum sediminis]PLW83685.1 peptidase M48 Ste24p [Kineobactrum sediminis]